MALVRPVRYVCDAAKDGATLDRQIGTIDLQIFG